jgi:DNA end-binding protein Ku
MAGVTLTFGLISIPCKSGLAASSKAVSFTKVTKDGHNRVKGKQFDVVTGKEVEADDLMRAYEVKKGKNPVVVPLTDADFKSLQATEDGGNILLQEFVTGESIRQFEIEKTYFLSPNAGAERSYALLAFTMLRRGVIAVGQLTSGGKENIVVIRPHQEGDTIGLLLQPIFYQHEMRSFLTAGVSASRAQVTANEAALADRLVETLFTGTFDTTKYTDSFAQRVKELIERKQAGIVTPEQPEAAPEQPAEVIDLMALLEQSLKQKKAS